MRRPRPLDAAPTAIGAARRAGKSSKCDENQRSTTSRDRPCVADRRQGADVQDIPLLRKPYRMEDLDDLVAGLIRSGSHRPRSARLN